MPQSRRLCDGRALPRKTGIFRGTAAFEEPMNQAETPPKTVTACVLIIGNEILSGRTQDANLAFLAQDFAPEPLFRRRVSRPVRGAVGLSRKPSRLAEPETGDGAIPQCSAQLSPQRLRIGEGA